MIDRALYHIAFSPEWGRQMRFITGPRQSGKTTLAKIKLKNENISHLYYLWDSRSVRNKYKEDELFFTEDDFNSRKKLWVCFDEIHKMPKWKNILKGIFDQTEDNYQFIITGSAKLDISKKKGDSLSGRYFTFRLLPLSLRELVNAKKAAVEFNLNSLEFVKNRLDKKEEPWDYFSSLMEYGGFPEPFLKQSKPFLKKWTDDYPDRVINEDIGTLTRIIEREYLYDIYNILPEMVGSPISMNSIASHIEINMPRVKNYLNKLCDFFLTFKIHPYSKNIKRSLIKAPKLYLYNWSCIKDKAKKFENFIACELNSLLHLWKDTTGESYSLFYIRTKDKKETDFLILKNTFPWLLIEVKLSDQKVANHHIEISKTLGNIPIVQICYENNIALMQLKNVYRISASRFFQ